MRVRGLDWKCLIYVTERCNLISEWAKVYGALAGILQTLFYIASPGGGGE